MKPLKPRFSGLRYFVRCLVWRCDFSSTDYGPCLQKGDMEMIRIGSFALRANGLSFILWVHTVYSFLFLVMGGSSGGAASPGDMQTGDLFCTCYVYSFQEFLAWMGYFMPSRLLTFSRLLSPQWLAIHFSQRIVCSKSTFSCYTGRIL